MIRDYEKGTGIQGVLRSLIGERVVGALLSNNNTITIFFESGCGVALRAWDYGAIVLRPMSVEDALASVKGQIRDADLHQANLRKALKHLGECATKPRHTEEYDVTTSA